jgi:hypothetical protein
MPPDKRPERRRAAPSGLISYGFDIVDQSRLAAGYAACAGFSPRDLTSTLDERLGPPSRFPVAAGDLLCSNDAGIAGRQTASSRSLAVPTSKIGYASYRRDSTRKVGEDTADSPGRAHLFLLCTKIIVRSSPGCIDPDQHGGNPGQCDPRIAVAVRDKVRATLVFA